MRVHERDFSPNFDIELNALRNILQVTPTAGLKMFQGSLRANELVIQRHRVLHSLRRVDPVASTLTV